MTTKIIAITTTKTARAKGAKEYYLSDYGGSFDEALAAAKADSPRRKKFYQLESVGVLQARATLIPQQTL